MQAVRSLKLLNEAWFIQERSISNVPMPSEEAKEPPERQEGALPEEARLEQDAAVTKSLPHADETALIARTLQGDRSAFDVLFLRYQDYVYRIVYGVVGNVEEAKDLTQEVFLQAFRALPHFRKEAKFATWLYRIAINRATDAVRTSQRRRFLPLWDWLVADSNAETDCRDIPERETVRSQVQEALLRCPLILRQALVLRYYNECNLEEMAEILNCSVDAVKVRLHRARMAFKEAYVAVCKEQEPFGYKEG